jgi:hypothetical protein
MVVDQQTLTQDKQVQRIAVVVVAVVVMVALL